MAKDSKDTAPKKPAVTRTRKKQQTVRERAQAAQKKQPRKLRTTASKVKPLASKANIFGKKEYHLPLPDNKIGKILKKRVYFVPKFVKNSWNEIKQVTWPNRHDTIRLTIAVFIFSVIFAIIVGLLDYALDKIFKEVIIKR